MNRWTAVLVLLLGIFVVAVATAAVTSTVVLAVDGMT